MHELCIKQKCKEHNVCRNMSGAINRNLAFPFNIYAFSFSIQSIFGDLLISCRNLFSVLLFTKNRISGTCIVFSQKHFPNVLSSLLFPVSIISRRWLPEQFINPNCSFFSSLVTLKRHGINCIANAKHRNLRGSGRIWAAALEVQHPEEKMGKKIGWWRASGASVARTREAGQKKWRMRAKGGGWRVT